MPSKVEMATPTPLIYKMLFPSISTFETPPFTSVDLFLTPTMPQVAPRIDQTVPPPPPRSNPFSLSRHPAISVPCGLSREHLPIGLQIVGRRYEDEFVLASAQAFETSAEHLQDFRLRALALRA